MDCTNGCCVGTCINKEKPKLNEEKFVEDVSVTLRHLINAVGRLEQRVAKIEHTLMVIR